MFKHLQVLFFVFITTFIQAQVKVGEWKDHLSYNSCNTVVKVGDIVYASNGTGIIKYDTKANTIDKWSKINLLSDIGIQLLRYNSYNNTLLVIYDNANIDVIKGDEVSNFSDIKRKNIIGKKNINEVLFKNNLAYLSCGFGIVVFDTDKLEIKDTYYIGPGGNYINVFQLEITDSTFIAATSAGLLKAKSNSLLNNYQNWTVIPNVPAGVYNGIVKYKNKLVANYSPFAANGNLNRDTLYTYSSGVWQKETMKPFPYTIKKMFPAGDYLSFIEGLGYELYNPLGTRTMFISVYQFGSAVISDVSADISSLIFWIADLKHGLIKSYGPAPFFANFAIGVNGTHSNYVSNIDIHDGKVIISPTKIEETGV